MIGKRTQANVISAIAAVALAITFVACGFAACAGLPLTTEALARATSAEDLSPFTREQLVQAGMATRAYTVETADRTALMDAIAAINNEANTRYADATPDQLATAPDAYTLTPEALSHLDDVYQVINRVLPALFGAAVLAAFLLMALVRMYGRRPLAYALAGAGGAVLAVFAALGLWALVDFNGLFAVLHSLFFAAGTWTFASDSLLICMYPQAFWMGMGAIWLATTVVLSILSLAIGCVLIKRARTQSHTVQ